MNRFLRFSAACGFAILGASAFTFAQTTPSKEPAGLELLSDVRLMHELANRGLTSLLDRAFEINNVPAPQREVVRTLVALRQLSEGKMSTAQRQALVTKVVAGIEQALPSLSDPATMMNQASALLQYGVEREVNTLEYWGETARSQVPLRPIVEAVIKLLDKTAAEAQKRADVMANAITGPNDPRAKQWEDLANLVTSATYTRHVVDYYLCLSMDSVASTQRKDVAGKAIEYLTQFDNAESTLQPVVRLYIGKLHMMRSEHDKAKEVFAGIASGKGIDPPPNPSQQWEARYFSAMSDLLARQPAAAQKSLDAVIAWERANLKDKASLDGAEAAASMLQYRIHSLIAETAGGEVAKKANADAVKVLTELVKKRPDLQTIIFQQLMAKLPANADLKTLDTLLLQGFVSRAEDERQRPENEKVDTKTLERGVQAAREILRRRKTQEVDPQLAETDSLIVGFILERLNRHAEAAEAFLDYLRDFGLNASNAQIALDNTLAIVGRLRSDAATANHPATSHAYERVLPIAINPPFSRTEFAYEYARQLQDTGRAKEAIDYFRRVPQNDKRMGNARFYEMAALHQRLDDEKLPPAERQQIVAQVQQMVDGVAKQVSEGMNAATNDADRKQFRSKLVRTLLVAADLARREQGNPQRTLALLENFESLAAGLPNERELVGTVLNTRVQAYMALGKSDAATQTLVTLLKSRPGSEGANMVLKLLQKLDSELDQARLAGQRDRMQVLAKNRAQLSGFLVDWAKNNTDPNIKKFTYRYSVFDAATKHLAADMETDAAARKAGLQAALALYRKLESPESAELYRATLAPNSPEAAYPDPAVSLGIGLISFDLGDFGEAQKRLGLLLTERKLGTPTIAVEENGQTKVIENDQYWEATLRLMRSNLALADANAGDANAQAAKTETLNYLKQLYVRWGREVGGKKWSPEFEKLRAERIPEFNPDDVAVETTQPTTGVSEAKP
jgi:lipopolysaccharide biosynthesis regulator YciM